MWAFIGIICFLGAIVFLVMGIIAAMKKNGKARNRFVIFGGLFIVFIAALAASPSSSDDSKTSTTDNAAVKASDTADSAAANTSKQGDANAQTKTMKKGTTFDINGTFAVNDEIKPGLYRAEDGVAYWARLKGFSGELDDIIANGSASGPALVEIKPTDKGFQTMGTGSEWVPVDASYAPQKRTAFGDGAYIVGKDIDPGTYKSEASVTYWSRLKGFSGDLDDIIANGAPDGAAIIEIKATDAGFTTLGGGTWKKIK